MTAVALELRRIRPWELEVGDEVTISVPLPSEDGYRHVVADVRELRGGWLRVWFEVYNADGEQRGPALEGRECFQWDRLYNVAGHPADIEWLEVVA